MKKIICKLTPFVKSYIAWICTLLLLCMSLAACGGHEEDPALEAYRTEMTSFCTSIETLARSIDSIDPSSENADVLFLDDLDKMNAAFRKMAETKVPEGYSEAGTLAYEAAAFMTDAVSLYHEAYDGETYNAEFASQAQMQYENAMQRVSSIGQYFMEH